MYCKNCGTHNAEGVYFCKKCGNVLDGNASSNTENLMHTENWFLEVNMLDFARDKFHSWYNVSLWIGLFLTILFGLIYGGIIGGPLGIIIGGALGILIGLFTVVIAGGLVATLLNIDYNIEKMKKYVIKEDSSGSSLFWKKCPFCAEEIKKEAVVCKFCGKDIPVLDDKQKLSTDNTTPQSATSEGNLKIRRIKSDSGTFTLVDIFIDGKLSFSLLNGEEKVVEIAKGKHEILVKNTKDTCNIEFEIANDKKEVSILTEPKLKLSIIEGSL